MATVRFYGQEGSMTFEFGPRNEYGFPCDGAEIEFGPLRGRLDTKIGFDVEEVRRDLEALLTSSDLSGEMHVAEAVEHEFVSRLRLDHGRGMFRTEISTNFAGQDGSVVLEMMVDQSCLKDTLLDLKKM